MASCMPAHLTGLPFTCRRDRQCSRIEQTRKIFPGEICVLMCLRVHSVQAHDDDPSLCRTCMIEMYILRSHSSLPSKEENRSGSSVLTDGAQCALRQQGSTTPRMCRTLRCASTSDIRQNDIELPRDIQVERLHTCHGQITVNEQELVPHQSS